MPCAAKATMAAMTYSPISVRHGPNSLQPNSAPAHCLSDTQILKPRLDPASTATDRRCTRLLDPGPCTRPPQPRPPPLLSGLLAVSRPHRPRPQLPLVPRSPQPAACSPSAEPPPRAHRRKSRESFISIISIIHPSSPSSSYPSDPPTLARTPLIPTHHIPPLLLPPSLSIEHYLHPLLGDTHTPLALALALALAPATSQPLGDQLHLRRPF